MSVFKYNLPVAFDGFQTVAIVDVSAYMEDATQALWEFYDLDGTEIVGSVAPTDAATVTITVSPALVAGSYQLVGIQ